MPIARNDKSVLGHWWWTVDRWSLFALFALAILGLFASMAASPSVAERIGADTMHFVRKQALFLVPSLIIMITVSLLDIKSIRRLGLLMFFGSLVLLVAVLIFGSEIKGAKRWVYIAGFNIQPSEFIKPAFAIVGAWLFSLRHGGQDFPIIGGYKLIFIFYVLIATLLLMQPDIGQTLLFSAIWFTQFFLAGLPIWIVAVVVAAILISPVGVYYLFPHAQSRINRFLDPTTGDNYQIDRAMQAFMNGGIFGKGPGEGTIKNALPDGHSDFVFAVLGEEFGLIACLLVVMAFIFILVRSFSLIQHKNNMFILLATAGLIVQFCLQALINMASTLHMIPTKGMTLPFISYGGSSILALAIGMGMVLALTRKHQGEAGY